MFKDSHHGVLHLQSGCVFSSTKKN